MTQTYRALRPRKRSLAKANPARVEKRTTDRVMAPAAIRLFDSAFQNRTWSKTRCALLKKLPPGSSGGVESKAVVDSRLAPSACQYNGEGGPGGEAGRRA